MISIKAHINNVALHHTIFDLRFAFMGAVLAANGHPRLIDLFWIAMAITTGRAAAMAIDNLADLKYDKQQPRMAYRAMVAGRISKREALAFIVICLMLMVLSVLQLQPICIYLLPLAARAAKRSIAASRSVACQNGPCRWSALGVRMPASTSACNGG